MRPANVRSLNNRERNALDGAVELLDERINALSIVGHSEAAQKLTATREDLTRLVHHLNTAGVPIKAR